MRNIFLSAKFQQEFEQKGYVIMPLLSASEVNFVLSEIQLMKPDDKFNPAIISGRTSSHITDIDTNTEYKREAKKLITNILTPHLKNIFDDYKILNPNFIIKPPGKGYLGIHQDWTFVSNPEKYTSLTLWCPLVDTNESNATLQVVEASHKIVPNIATSTGELYWKDFESAIVDKYSKFLCIKAGECVIFDHSLLHFSGDNVTEQPRYVLQVVIVPTEVEPVFYFFDRKSPEKGFEVFQIEADFFVHQNFFTRPSTSKSLGFVENKNEFLTEDEFVSRIKTSYQTRIDRYIVGQLPEGLRNDPPTPANLVKKLGQQTSNPKFLIKTKLDNKETLKGDRTHLASHLTHLKKALLIKPNNPAVYDRMAELCYEQGDLDKTLEVCLEALQTQLDLVIVPKILPQVLQRLGFGEAEISTLLNKFQNEITAN